jgi:hypothetical protein
MVACKVLSPFTEYVPGTGMVVGNLNAVVELPLRYARVRRERGFVDYKDGDAAEEEGMDAARPKSRIEKRLMARAQRRAERAARPAAAAAPPRETTPPSRIGEASTKAAAKPKAKGRSKARTPANPALAAARADYKAVVGKNPSPRLDAAGIREKLAEIKASGSAPAPAKRPSRAKKPAIQSDAPVE